MFNKLYKLYRLPSLTVSSKQKNKIFLLKDLRQYKFEYINVINQIIGKNWPLGNKKIAFNNLKLINILKYLMIYIFYFNLFCIIIY